MTLSQARKLATAASQVKLAGGSSKTVGVPWAWIQENCNRRASMVNFALSEGDAPSVLPNPIPSAKLAALATKPAFDSAQIVVTGPLNVKEQFVVPGAGAIAKTTLAAWDHHIAAVVNVSGTLMVIDPSLKAEPLEIKAWIASYLPATLDCQLVDDAAYHEIHHYYLTRFQFPGEKPSRPCGYAFNRQYGVRSADKVTAETIRAELEGAAELLHANFQYLRSTMMELTGDNIADDVVPKVGAVVTPLTDAQMCKEMNYAFKWCSEYAR